MTFSQASSTSKLTENVTSLDVTVVEFKQKAALSHELYRNGLQAQADFGMEATLCHGSVRGYG